MWTKNGNEYTSDILAAYAIRRTGKGLRCWTLYRGEEAILARVELAVAQRAGEARAAFEQAALYAAG